jgi:hypothetical protein
VSTIDGTSPTNPAEVPGGSPQRVPRITLVIHGSPTDLPTAVSSPLPRTTPAPTAEAGQLVRQQRGGRHELVDSTWFGRLERLLHSWPITLRLALLVAVVLTGTAAVAATLGIGGQLLLAALSLRARGDHRRRLAAVRALTTTAETTT